MGGWLDGERQADRQTERQRQKDRDRERDRYCLLSVHLPVTAMITDVTAASSIQHSTSDVIVSLMLQCSRECRVILLSEICRKG